MGERITGLTFPDNMEANPPGSTPVCLPISPASQRCERGQPKGRLAGAAALTIGYSERVKSRLAGSPPAALAARTAFKIAAATTSAA